MNNKSIYSKYLRFLHYFNILFLFFIVLLIYFPVSNYDFVNWDDNKYVYDNLDVQEISLNNLKNIFSKEYVSLYIPITMLSYLFDHVVFGESAAGFHVINIIFHCLNVLMVYVLLISICKDKRLVLITSIIFAIHPVQVETVAWISQRKTLLSSAFILLSFYFYRKNSASGTKKGFFLSIIFFILSLLSKPIYVLFPVVLYYYDLVIIKRTWRKAFDNKMLYLILSIACALSTILFHKSAGSIYEFREGSILLNSIVSFSAIGLYIRLFILPTDLSLLYELSHFNVLFYIYLFVGLIVSSILFMCLYSFTKSKKDEAFWIVWITCFFLPVSGFMFPLATIANDRYLYLLIVGLSILFIKGVLNVFDKKRSLSKSIKVIFLVSILIVLSLISKERTQIWKNSYTLWKDTALKTKKSSHPYTSLGHYLIENQRYKEAKKYLNIAVKRDPFDCRAFINLSIIALSERNYNDAIEILKKAEKLSPGNIDILNKTGITYAYMGEKNRALQYFEKIIAINPGYFEAYLNAALITYEQGKLEASSAFIKDGIKNGEHSYKILTKFIKRYRNLNKKDIADFLEKTANK